MPYAILNNELLEEEKASIPIDDRGFLYGEAAFTTIRLYNGKPLALFRHCRRLNTALASQALNIDITIEPDEIIKDIEKLVEANKCPDGVLKIRVTGGSGAGVAHPADRKPLTLITLGPLPDFSERTEKGIKVVRSSVIRDRKNQIGRHKTASYLESILAKQQATVAEADDGIITDSSGNLLECSSSNIFAVVNGLLVTADIKECILPGIARSLIIDRGRATGIPLLISTMPAKVAETATEMFICNSVTGIIPIREFEDIKLPDIPGPITSKLQEEYEKLTTAEAIEALDKKDKAAAAAEAEKPEEAEEPEYVKEEEYEEDQQGHEKRVSARYQIVQDVAVYNRKEDKLIGRLFNLSIEGMLVVGRYELETMKDFSLKIEYPDGDKTETLKLHAACVRASIIAGKYHGSGFRFLDTSKKFRKKIDKLIEKLAGNELA
ncbi:MAG: aminotransferase class IV [Planctomycetota bacterium]|jgi:branched-subunit amino acid aminotransferase/4-amino-4-deoxychorismate lyase